jgi:membrane-associated phospholipid phosphatase
MNEKVVENYSKLQYWLLLIPLMILVSLVLFLYTHDALNINGYIAVQKDWFYKINATLSQFPQIIYNLTQIGDALIFLSLLSILLIYAPAVWEALLSASLISLLISSTLKNIFAVPRPAAFLDNNTFTIIGQKLQGHSSLPSGHSITVFTTLTVLLFAFLPKKMPQRIVWILLMLCFGFLIALTRVGVGAHFPFDVLTGSTLGFMSALGGIFLSRKYKIWRWIGNKKYYPIFILLLLICGIGIANKIAAEFLPVYLIGLLVLIFSLYKITHVYLKK